MTFSRPTNQPLSEVLLFRSLDGLIGRDPRSILLLTDELLDLLLLNLISCGSAVSKPPTLANNIKISVRLTTPTRVPLILAPGKEAAETLGPDWLITGVFGVASETCLGSEEVACGTSTWNCPDAAELWEDVGTNVAVWRDGVVGAEDIGESGSVTHIRWLFVATSLATVWARVFIGVTWKTGNESFPSNIPLVDKMTEMKCIHVFRSRGSDEDFVSNFVSVVEMLPTTLLALSRTAKEEIPSSRSKARPSARGWSPLSLLVRPVSSLSTHLIDMGVLEPILRSLKYCEYSWSMTGNWRPFSQRNRINLVWLSRPVTSIRPSWPSFATNTRCTPLPNVSMAFVRLADSGKNVTGSLRPISLMALNGIGLPWLASSASLLNLSSCSSVGCAIPTAVNRYAFNAL